MTQKEKWNQLKIEQKRLYELVKEIKQFNKNSIENRLKEFKRLNLFVEDKKLGKLPYVPNTCYTRLNMTVKKYF